MPTSYWSRLCCPWSMLSMRVCCLGRIWIELLCVLFQWCYIAYAQWNIVFVLDAGHLQEVLSDLYDYSKIQINRPLKPHWKFNTEIHMTVSPSTATELQGHSATLYQYTYCFRFCQYDVLDDNGMGPCSVECDLAEYTLTVGLSAALDDLFLTVHVRKMFQWALACAARSWTLITLVQDI